MFAAAVVDRIIGASPCNGVRLPEIRKRNYYIPNPSEIHDLAHHIAARYSPIPYIAAGCGLRGGEIFGLKLDHVDFCDARFTFSSS
jgi:integrase